jgi:hypothetical protein
MKWASLICRTIHTIPFTLKHNDGIQPILVYLWVYTHQLYVPFFLSLRQFNQSLIIGRARWLCGWVCYVSPDKDIANELDGECDGVIICYSPFHSGEADSVRMWAHSLNRLGRLSSGQVILWAQGPMAISRDKPVMLDSGKCNSSHLT